LREARCVGDVSGLALAISIMGDVSKLLEGKLGVANERSIAWAIAQAWHDAGARLAFTYQGERLKEN